MRTDVLVYLSGPITARSGRRIEAYVADALAWFLECIKAGIPAFCPHLSAAFPSSFVEVDYETWMQYDFAVIDRCTHVLMLPDFATSPGAVRERAYAESLGKPIVYSLEELVTSLGQERAA